jgi:hypothetical protein
MDFIEHTQNWIKGEIFEAKWIVLFGLFTIIVAFLFWKTGTTPNAKAMLFPLLTVGILFLVSGSTMLYTNPKRSNDYAEAYKNDPVNLIEAEKERVEYFMTWYPQIRYVMTGIAVLGILLFLFWSVPIGRAIGIALILIALTTFVIDHFSEERANIYYEQIINYLN